MFLGKLASVCGLSVFLELACFFTYPSGIFASSLSLADEFRVEFTMT